MLTVLVALAATAGQDTAQAEQVALSCQQVSARHFLGPFDYRSASAKSRAEVDNYHFTSNVEMLVSGKTTPTPGPDINYVLRIFPNHYRALVALTRLADKERTDTPKGMLGPVDCYFERAIGIWPSDPLLRNLYAQWLGSRGRKDEAGRQLAAALPLAGDNALTHYNIGLLYAEIGDYPRARQQALRAQELGWPGPGLIEKLKAAGQWPGTPMAPLAPEAAPSSPSGTAPAPT